MDSLGVPNHGPLAFAMCIVKSKPDECSIQEYIRLLQRHIAKGRRENAISAAYRHLDRSSFWRSEYEWQKDALIAKENEVLKLSRELEASQAKLEAAQASTATKKRKQIDSDASLVPSLPKRARTGSASVTEQAPCMTLAQVLEFPVSGLTGANHSSDKDRICMLTFPDDLMRSLFTIKHKLRAHTTLEALDLYPHFVRVASALPQIFSDGLAQSFLEPARDRIDLHVLHNTCAVAKRVIALMIASVNKAGCSHDSQEAEGSFIHAFVQMYADLLKCLHKASARVITTLSRPRAAVSDKLKPAKANPISKPRPTNMKDNPVLNAVTSFLCGIIELLDPELKLHNALFEGIAYSVIDKTGSALFTLMFGHARGETTEEEIASCAPIDETAGASVVDVASSHTSDNSGAKLLAPFLIHLLKRVMAASPSHLGSNQKVRAGAARKITKGSSKGLLAVSAKERLQRTLINSMFGIEGLDENDPFMDCLRMPIASPALLHIPRVKESGIEEWFQEEVWRLLGWEILAKEDSW